MLLKINKVEITWIRFADYIGISQIPAIKRQKLSDNLSQPRPSTSAS